MKASAQGILVGVLLLASFGAWSFGLPGVVHCALSDDCKKTLEEGAGQAAGAAKKIVEVTSPAGLYLKTVEEAGKSTTEAAQKALGGVTAVYTKAWKDVGQQARASFDDTVEAAKAAERFGERQLQLNLDSAKKSLEQAKEGKYIDAIWGDARRRAEGTESNAFKATQESKVINAGAQAAAVTYGGPGGAAAYAAWSTYRATGDANLAFRAGLASAAQAQFGTTIQGMPAGTAGEAVRKAALAGAAGGIAVAAAGGDEKAIQEGFLKAGGSVLLQVGSDKAKAYVAKSGEAGQALVCISAKDVDCLSKTTYAKDLKGRFKLDGNGKPIIDQKVMDTAKQVGKFVRAQEGSLTAKELEVTRGISKLPQAEVIPVLKNRYAVTWSLGKTKADEIQYGVPAVVLTQVGAEPPFVFEASYKGGPPSETLVAHYYCAAPPFLRELEVVTEGTSCEALHYREARSTEVIWQSPSHPESCVPKTLAFIKHLKTLDVSCVKG